MLETLRNKVLRPLRQAVRRHRDRRLPEHFKALRRARVNRDAIALWGFLNSEIGLGTMARRCAVSLKSIRPGALCYSIPLRDRNSVTFDADKLSIRPGFNIIVVNPPELLAANKYFPKDYMSGAFKVGYWAWELPSVPTAWLPAYDLVDEVWTFSSFAAKALQSATTKRVATLPIAIEDWPHATREEARQLLQFPNSDQFIFLTIFDFASAFERKNPLGTIAAFNRAFGQSEHGPLLVLKYHSAGASAVHTVQENRLREAAAANRRIRLIDRLFTPLEVRRLHDASDCFVSLHRSEGFGLNIADAMISGHPAICTGYSGNLDFTTPENALLIDFDMVTVGKDEYAQSEGLVWADPKVEQAASAMVLLYNDRQRAYQIGQRARETILRDLNPASVAQTLDGLLTARRELVGAYKIA